jgi:hypothetical protein
VLCSRCHHPITNTLDRFEGYCPLCCDWTTLGELGRTPQPNHYDRAGKPMPMSLWVMALESHLDQRVAEDFIDTDEGQVRVSTIWLGLDMGFTYFSQHAVPMIFETMIFGGKHDQSQWRYPTEEAAQAGHDQAVALVVHTAYAL